MSLPADYTAPGKVSNNADVVYGYRTVTFHQWTDPITAAVVPGKWIAPEAGRLKSVGIAVTKAPTGTNGVTVDVDINGTTAFTTQGNRPVIAENETSAVSGDPDGGEFEAGDVITATVDTVGGTEPGEYLTVTVAYLPGRP